MKFNPERVWESKASYRKELAALPFVAKLRILDRMKERDLAVRTSKPVQTKKTLSLEMPR